MGDVGAPSPCSLIYSAEPRQPLGRAVHMARKEYLIQQRRHCQSAAVVVQQWLGHSDISTTWMYDKRQFRPENSLKFKIKYLWSYDRPIWFYR